jgi:hypothetical protein
LKITAEELLLPPTRYGVATRRAPWDKILRARSTVLSIYNMKRYFMAVPTILIKVYNVQKKADLGFLGFKKKGLYMFVYFMLLAIPCTNYIWCTPKNEFTNQILKELFF